MADPIQSFYGRWAYPYDAVASLPPIATWRRRAVAALDIDPGETVVEMGCGTGANLPHLRAAVGPSGTVVGVDLTSGMLDRAADRIDHAGWDNVHLVRADATRPPLAGAVDALFGSFVVGLFADPATVVEEWIDLLAPDGRIALLDATLSDHALAAPANVWFRTFVRATAPGNRTANRSPAAALDAKVAAAREPITERTVDTRQERFALGFVQVTRGRRPG
jgi:ubiquinone/menaquinone biosynthesis C-methylase UbiE